MSEEKKDVEQQQDAGQAAEASKAKLDELQRASVSKDRVITDLQEGKAVPKWLQQEMKTAGIASREDLLGLLGRKGEAQPNPKAEAENKPSRFDPAKYADDDGVVTADKLPLLMQDLLATARAEAQSEREEAEKSAAILAESTYIAEVAASAPETLIGEDEDTIFVGALLDGYVSQTIKGAATREQVKEALEKAKGWIGRIADKEVVRRAKEAELAATKEPPAGSPGSGEGPPKEPKQAPPDETPVQRRARMERESAAEFSKAHIT